MGLISSFTTGAYYHFWYLYLIAGLYLITPLLRAGVIFNRSKTNRVPPQKSGLHRHLHRSPFTASNMVSSLPGEFFVVGGFTGLLPHGFLSAKRTASNVDSSTASYGWIHFYAC